MNQPKPVEVLQGTNRPHSLVTAPHAMKHHRRGQEKDGDLRTGQLARDLHTQVGVTAVISTTRDGDANWDLRHPVKEAAVSAITGGARFALDLHGMSDITARRVGADIEFGTGDSEDGGLLAACRAAADSAGLTHVTDKEHTARVQPTMTRAAQAAGASAIQIEMSKDLRCNRYHEALEFLSDLVNRLPEG